MLPAIFFALGGSTTLSSSASFMRISTRFFHELDKNLLPAVMRDQHLFQTPLRFARPGPVSAPFPYLTNRSGADIRRSLLPSLLSRKFNHLPAARNPHNNCVRTIKNQPGTPGVGILVTLLSGLFESFCHHHLPLPIALILLVNFA
jgi:hypothetical protein